jgi:hypothetical protein
MINFPTFESFADASKFFIDVKNENGEEDRAMINLRKACVVISVPCRNNTVSKVAFYKTSRSRNFRDSRYRKYVDGKFVKAELQRLLQDDFQADLAWRALQV